MKGKRIKYKGVYAYTHKEDALKARRKSGAPARIWAGGRYWYVNAKPDRL